MLLFLSYFLRFILPLKAFGNLLVVSDPLVKADAIVVLDGDYPQAPCKEINNFY